ncbi:MAG: sulfotransferase family 2 domain-containing protein [Candidatus Omnitrophica bacterium]|nr:sulfotransferase family 2 domain-containing protein [Candidatus Omnitrophota bacterium]
MAILLHKKHKVIFIHIPKTGGTSIRESIKKLKEQIAIPSIIVCPSSMQYKKYINILQNNTYAFKFTFVRNPWDRAVSSYMHLRYSKELNPEDSSFKKFIKTYYQGRYDNPGTKKDIKWHMIPQHFLIYNKGGPLVDFIGHFEKLQIDFDILCDIINVPRQRLPHLLKTTHNHYSEYYDTETRELVKKIYKKDIELFKYSF